MLRPLVEYVENLRRDAPGELVTVVVPEIVPRHWWEHFLHNKTALYIRTAFLFRPGKYTLIIKATDKLNKKTAEQKMARSIEAFKNELQKIRTGRAHPGILDQVQVDYYGSQVPIGQVANVTLLDAPALRPSQLKGLLVQPGIDDDSHAFDGQ